MLNNVLLKPSGTIRDDYSQKSAMKQKLFTQVKQGGVNFAPETNNKEIASNLGF